MDFYHNWTNSILQQLKKTILENCRCIVPNFMNESSHLNKKHGAFYGPYSIVPDPQNVSKFLKL
jgi:hypothetical protein